MLHYLLQEHGLLPHEIYALPDGQRLFVYASTMLHLEQLQRESRKK